MADFFDLWRRLLGWKAVPATWQEIPLYRVAAGQMNHSGAEAGRHVVPGATAGQAFHTGSTKGAIHGGCD